MEVPPETNNKIIVPSSNPIPRHISGQNYNLKINMYPYVHRRTIHNSQETEITSISINR